MRCRIPDQLLGAEAGALQFLEGTVDDGLGALERLQERFPGLALAAEIVRQLSGNEPLHYAVVQFERLPLSRSCDFLLAEGLRVSALDRMLEAPDVGEALQGDVDRALQLLRVPVDDVGKNAARFAASCTHGAS
jgi:hypothetical protein